MKVPRVVTGLGAIGFLALAPMRLVAQSELIVGPDSLTAAPNRIVLTLPDSGGWLLNNTPLDSAVIDGNLEAIYARRPTKILLLNPGPNRSRADLEWVAALARRRGITVFLVNRAVERTGVRAM